jgi:hypothetical protein
MDFLNHTVKNGKFKKILTSEIKTMKLFICNSKICFRSFTPFNFRVQTETFVVFIDAALQRKNGAYRERNISSGVLYL